MPSQWSSGSSELVLKVSEPPAPAAHSASESARVTVAGATKENATSAQSPSGTLRLAANTPASATPSVSPRPPGVPAARATARNVYARPPSTPMAEPQLSPESKPSPTGSCCRPHRGAAGDRAQVRAEKGPCAAGAGPPGSGAQRGGKPGGKGCGHDVPGGCSAKARLAMSSADRPPYTSCRVNSRSSPSSEGRMTSRGKPAATLKLALCAG